MCLRVTPKPLHHKPVKQERYLRDGMVTIIAILHSSLNWMVDRSKIEQLIEALPKERDGTVVNDAVLWVFWPDHAFAGKTPADVFPLEPCRVINEALIRRGGDRN